MYTLRFPFALPPEKAISVTEQSSTIGVLNLTLTKKGSLYILNIEGFSSEEEAKKYIRNIWAGLMWLLIHRELSADAKWEPQTIIYSEDPHQAAKNISENLGVQIDGPVDGLLTGDSPAVYMTGKRLRSLPFPALSSTITDSAKNFFKYFSEGASFPQIPIEDQKLKLAFELYGAHFTELSAKAQFLALIMAFEALATGIPKTKTVLNLMEKWKKEVEELKKTIEPDSDDAASLTAIEGEILFRQEDSINRQIRRLVETTLQDNGDQDAKDVASNVVKLYKLRSILLHEGKLESEELIQATNDAKIIVKRVLLARFVRQTTNM
jgi:hypothetical protein